jgi:hypothetical protein
VGWTDLKTRVEERIQARRRKYGMDPQAGEAKVAEIDRKIQNYYRAIGEGLDPVVCKQLVSELQQKKQELETELATLRTEDYYALALEKNLRILETFRRKLGDGFERLPLGVQRQIVVEFVESIRIEQRREVAIHLKVALDNDGVQHLCDELDAVEKGAWKPEDEDTPEEGVNRSAVYGQSGPRWRPRQESNLRPTA